MNILLDRVPQSVRIGDKRVPINSDFRTGLRFELLMQSDLSDQDKLVRALSMYYDVIPDLIEQAVDQMLWFFRCGDIIKEKKQSGNNKVLYSYEHDQYLIYTAFLFYYQIDLCDVEFLHWWKFRKLFLELPEEKKKKKVMLYRSVSINGNMTKEQRKYYAEMKRIYALPDDQTVISKANRFANVLANGMKLPESEVML